MRSQQQRQSPEAGIRDFLDTHAVTVEPGAGGEAHAMPMPPPSFGAAGMGLLDTYTHEVWPPEAAVAWASTSADSSSCTWGRPVPAAKAERTNGAAARGQTAGRWSIRSSSGRKRVQSS